MERIKILNIWNLMTTLMILVMTVGAEIPADFPKCKHGDEPCLVKATNEVIEKYNGGLKEVNLIQFDPLHVKSMNLERNPSSPVNVDIKLRDLVLEGLKTMKVTSFQGLKADLSGRNTVAGTISHLSFNGKYIVDGQVLVLPITGEGTVRFICKNLRFSYSFDLEPVEKDGKIYANLKHVKMDMEPEHVEFYFDNLFNGDKTLTDTTNEFINTNWKEIYHELQPAISKGVSLVVKSLVNNFYKKHPYEEYFL